jgi:hypothetical protein
MACARCDFYLPKASTQAQLAEAKGHLQRMLTMIPMTEDERAAVEDGADAVEQVLNRPADTPTPPGPMTGCAQTGTCRLARPEPG